MVKWQAHYTPACLLSYRKHGRMVAQFFPHSGLVQWAEMEHRGYRLVRQMSDERISDGFGLHHDKEAMVICLAVGW